MHKGKRGRLLVIGGYAAQPEPESAAHARFGFALQPNFQLNYIGAPALSALGALRAGAGVVTLLSYPEICDACAARLPEIVYQPLNEPEQWIKAALHDAELYGAAVIGPGLGRSKEAMFFAIEMWQKWPKPLVVDGDGLFALSVVRDNLNPRDDAIITPHEGEAAKLLDTSVDFIHENREDCVKKLAEKWGCAVLKGHNSLIAGRNGENSPSSAIARLTEPEVDDNNNIYEIPYGGAELSVPGSGDVLAGCIGALLASKLNVINAAVLGTAIHGMAGDILRKKYGVDGNLASEIAGEIRTAINNLRNLNYLRNLQEEEHEQVQA